MRWLLIAALALCAVSAEAASLTVRVENIDKAGGFLHVALYDEARWPDNVGDPLADIIVPAVAPATVVTFKEVVPGTYGVKTYQDVNKNDKFDQGFFGIPLERYGFSRDARPRLSEPSFRRVKFVISPGETAIVIHLQ
jgi:uncharacterized protein (DUF2141 family)